MPAAIVVLALAAYQIIHCAVSRNSSASYCASAILSDAIACVSSAALAAPSLQMFVGSATTTE
jgi:hypothetical protein